MRALPLFDDRIVSSSELHRRSGEVLRYAGERQVTITRADGDLVLMRRSLAANLVRTASAWPDILLALVGLIVNLTHEKIDWSIMSRLESDDLTTLGFELAAALRNAGGTEEALKEASTVLYEWVESMTLTQDPDIKKKLESAERSVMSRRRVCADSPHGAPVHDQD